MLERHEVLPRAQGRPGLVVRHQAGRHDRTASFAADRRRMNALTSAHLDGRKQKADRIQVSGALVFLLELARRASRGQER